MVVFVLNNVLGGFRNCKAWRSAAVPKTAEQLVITLFYVDLHNLWLVCVLYVDVNWHGVLPLLFCFIFSLRPVALRYENAGCEHR